MQRQSTEQIAVDTEALLRFAGRVHTLPDSERESMIGQWESRVAQDGTSSDAVLVLALVLGQPGRATPTELTQARRLLTEYLNDPANPSKWKQRLAAHQLTMLGGMRGSDVEVARLLHLASGMDRLSATEWRRRVRQLDNVPTMGGTSADGRLELALLLGSGQSGHGQNLARARRLLEAYLADQGNVDPVLRDFAAYHLRLFERRQQQLRVAMRERRKRRALEEKLEALKAIELRMTGEGGEPTVPLQ